MTYRTAILILPLIVGIAAACVQPEEQSVAGPVEPVESASRITLTPLGVSPEFPGASLQLADFDAASGSFEFAVESFELGAQTTDASGKGIANSGDGQHIHLIIDNGPYSAHYSPQAQAELEPGRHVVLAFLSRSYHESVKQPGAAVVNQVTVGETEEDQEDFDAEAPHLFYSRPKGTYSGADIERLMLDFYLANVDLSPDGYRVRADINGEEFILDRWQPYVIEGLSPGEVTVSLQLVDAQDNPISGPFNQVTRVVTLEAAQE